MSKFGLLNDAKKDKIGTAKFNKNMIWDKILLHE